MIGGRPLVLVLILLAAWFSLLCRTVWRLLRARFAAGGRSYLTIAGLGCATVAVGSLLAVHLSWISPDISQRFGVGTIRALALLLFWPTVAGFVLSIGGSGRIRFLGVGTCLVTGLWWMTLAMGAAISMSAPTARHPTRFLVPKGYIGWVQIEYGATAPPLSMKSGEYTCRIPLNGFLATSSPLEQGWAKDEYFYYSADGSLELLPSTGWGGGGMIWAESVGWKQETDSSKPREFIQSFYVGSEDQYHRNESKQTTHHDSGASPD